MKEIILAKYGEIILKGGNRPKFENILMNNIRNSLKNVAEVKARLAGMDPSLEEAARDLGAGPFRAFWDIILPLIMPAVMSGSLLAFAMSMDDVVISIFINGPRLATLPIKVYTQIKTGVTPEVNALCTIMLVFTVLILFVYTMIGKVTKGNNKNS